MRYLSELSHKFSKLSLLGIEGQKIIPNFTAVKRTVFMKRLLITIFGILFGINALASGAISGEDSAPKRRRQVEADRVSVEFLRPDRCLVRVRTDKKYVLFPVQEPREFVFATDGAFLEMVVENEKKDGFWIFPAVDQLHYFAPIDVSAYRGREIVLLICTNDTELENGDIRDYMAWNSIGFADEFNVDNREKYRPLFHPTTAFGWQSDPNGLIYCDGRWHLFYQHNPYGSSRGNESWGHSHSTDLVHWTYEGAPLKPDGLGRIFSGSCVVDRDNVSGLGKDALIAFYTSDWGDETQSQSIAYSLDGGLTFTKYAKNPILTEYIRDFRDPHVFWNEDAGVWNMLISQGTDMRIYSSRNLLDWRFESCWGSGYGSHASSWECPNMFKISSADGRSRWVILHSVNPVDAKVPHATSQYFTGSFDGHKFVCDSAPGVMKFLDYAASEYALITFNDAPSGRRVALGWMGYENNFPTRQYRCCVTMPRDIELYFEDGEAYLAMKPSPEIEALRKAPVVSKRSGSGKINVRDMFKNGESAYEIVCDIDPGEGCEFVIRLTNPAGEWVDVIYDQARGIITGDRSGTALCAQSPVKEGSVRGGNATQLRIFFDRSCIDIFDGRGTMSMPALCFPVLPYNSVECFPRKGRCAVKSLKVYPLE